MSTKSKILEIQDKIVEQRTIAKHLKALEESAALKHQELNQQLEKLDNELEDVLRLEELSVKQILHNIIGDKDEKLEKERAEYLEVSVTIKNIQESLDLIQFERDILLKKQFSTEGLFRDLERYKDIRIKEILKTSSADQIALRNLMSRVGSLTMERKEVEEARHILGEYRHNLENVLTLTKNAGYWHQQSMSNKSRRIYSNKLQAIDRAIFEYSKANILVDKVVKEMQDINLNQKQLNHELRLEIIRIKKTYNAKLPSQLKPNTGFIRNIITEFIYIKNLNSVAQQLNSALLYCQYTTDFLVEILQVIDDEFEKLIIEKDQLLTR